IVPLGDVVRDDRPRASLTAERLARLRPAFRDGGTETAGNSCGSSNGAAAVTAVDPALQPRLRLPGIRILATATPGFRPDRPELGLEDLDAVEINEAFAGQVLACCDELGLDPRRVCADGGALALGHPWGASGAVLVVRLLHRLVGHGSGRYGLAAIAAGGGQGVAMVVEAC